MNNDIWDPTGGDTGEPELKLTIDPGTIATGVAKWRADMWENPVPPFDVELVRTPKAVLQRDWLDKVAWQRDRFQALVGDDNVIEVFVELPMKFEGVKGDMVSAKGDLVKLTFLVGAFYGVCQDLGIPFEPVPVIEWKGQLPKPVVEKRIRDALGVKRCTSFTADVWDAVGIGLYKKGSVQFI